MAGRASDLAPAVQRDDIVCRRYWRGWLGGKLGSSAQRPLHNPDRMIFRAVGPEPGLAAIGTWLDFGEQTLKLGIAAHVPAALWPDDSLALEILAEAAHQGGCCRLAGFGEHAQLILRQAEGRQISRQNALALELNVRYLIVHSFRPARPTGRASFAIHCPN